MATTLNGPAQIQLEVQINEQYDGINDVAQLPPVKPNDDGAQTPPDDPSPTPPPAATQPCLPYMAFLAILIAFSWPFVLVLVNYWTDWTLWRFIKETHENYNDAYSKITSSSINISILTC